LRDYRDSHKNKAWQAYAAATGAAAAKAFLGYWEPTAREEANKIHAPLDLSVVPAIEKLRERQEEFSDGSDDIEYGDEQWRNVCRARRRDGKCFNCGKINHCETCWSNCGRRRLSNHTQSICRNPIKCDKCGGRNHAARYCPY
ncbi:hypothetical protein BDW68DRAFT_162873, partial [Aspergillus falconensis]